MEDNTLSSMDYEEMNDQEHWSKAFELARKLDGISVHDAEIIFQNTAQFIQRGSKVTTASQLFLSLEECLLGDS